MGQAIVINRSVVVDGVLVVDTDRSLTGQDGEAFTGAAPTPAGADAPARLAARLFEMDPAIDHVFVVSNTVTLRRAGGWPEHAVDRACAVIAGLFRIYPEG